MHERYPELARFFAIYFNKDWDMEAADDRGLVRLFLDGEQAEQVGHVRAELNDLLAEPMTDDELESTLRGSGFRYDPEFFGFTTRAWLERLKGLLAEDLPPEGLSQTRAEGPAAGLPPLRA